MKSIPFLLLLLLVNLFPLKAEQPTLSQLALAEHQIVLLQNTNHLIPLVTLDSMRLISISFGSASENEFNDMMRRYITFEKAAYYDTTKDSLRRIVAHASLCVVSVFKSQLTPEELTWINSLSGDQHPVILVSFVSPQQWMTTLHKTAWIEAYDDKVASQQMAAQLIFGGISAEGHLSMKFGKFPKGYGLTTPPPIRLKYTLPAEVGINGDWMTHTIDSLVNDAIAQQAFPGCVILVAKDGKVVFNKAYGYHTYFTSEVNHYPNDPLNRRENIYDLFDLASLTKIMAGAPAYLKLVDEGKIDLNEKFSHYFPPFKGTNKENITVQELLCHVGGLQPYYPFYKLMVNPDGTLKPSFIRSDSSASFPIKISPILFIRKDIATWVYDSIARSPLLKSNGKLRYVYSDWPFVVTPPVVEALVHESFEQYLKQTFYAPLGATEIMYNPWRQIPLSRIVPTEQDTYFRQTLLHGYVHDETSAILGGHSANAGLFANANDLAKLLQLYLQKGIYGGKRYFSEATFNLFNSTPYAAEGIYRGICFEKPDMKDGKVVGTSYLSTKVSPQSFGHTGYTGTMFWIDPKYNLVYIFLSNHVFPTRDNDKMFTTRIRAKVQTAIYDALNK